MKMLDLFSGIGGFSLAADWTDNIETVAFCEIDNFCQKILRKHWPDVPIYSDIKDLRGDEIGKVDIISGGFPCQPFSCAGRKKGVSDERYLWPEMLRIIREVRPGWVVGENVAGLLQDNNGKTIKRIKESLDNENYETRIVLLPASNYGASFEGKRLFIIATAKGSRRRRWSGKNGVKQGGRMVQEEQRWHPVWGETERRIIHAIRHQKTLPGDLRGNYGLSHWMDRIKSLGNAVVPQQVYPILKAITEIERMWGGDQNK